MINQRMDSKNYKFSSRTIDCYFDADLSILEKLVDKQNTIFITDQNVFNKQSPHIPFPLHYITPHRNLEEAPLLLFCLLCGFQNC